MKRFYCTVCKKIKHVRRLPANVNDYTYRDTKPEQRVGACTRHSETIEDIEARRVPSRMGSAR